MKVYTRKGDDGWTALADGSRVSKSALRVAAYGEVDELNAVTGLLRAEGVPGEIDGHLVRVQTCLFNLGARLADPAGKFAPTDDLNPAWIEEWIDAMDGELPPLRNFILPGGTRAGALAHLARTTCRRAERHVVALAAQAQEGSGAAGIRFLNRLSDAFFVLARFLNHRGGVTDPVWQGRG